MLMRFLMAVVALLTQLVVAGACASAALGADSLSIPMVRELMNGASHAHYGAPAAATVTIDGKPVSFLISLDAVGNITAVPQSPTSPYRQISIAVTTTNAGVVPNAVTLITTAGQVEGFTVTTSKDGAILAVVSGGPVTVPPTRPALAGTSRDRSSGSGSSGNQSDHGDHGGSGSGGLSDLVDETPAPPLGATVAGAGILYAPGTSPESRSVSPH
jgi:hypothetical protein